MSVISALRDNKVKSIEQAFGAADVTTPEMQAAISEWYELYYRRAPTGEEDPCQRIPYTVVNKLTKTVFSEYAATAQGGEGYLAKVLGGLELARKRAMQQALIGGECFLKPLFLPGRVRFAVVQRRNCLVLGRDEEGGETSIGTSETTVTGGAFYTLLERRSVDGAGYLTIESRLYRSTNRDYIGSEVPLGALEKYARLVPVNRLTEPVWSLGLIPVRTPMENCVDGSHDAVSVYAPAVGLIHNIDRNEAQINGEFERGESRIIVSADLLGRDELGRPRLTDHVFSGIDDAPDETGVTIFSPALREQSFLARKNEYLRDVENIIGLKRGILSEVEAAERTATEITSSAGDYNLTIVDFQQMWEGAVREAVRVCDVLGRMYRVNAGPAIDPEKDVSIDWGDGILYDEDKTWADYMSMVAAGMLKAEIALAWKFNLPWGRPEDLQKIRDTYMPELEALADGE